MGSSELSAAPALSTPAEHLFEHVEPEVPGALEEQSRRSNAELRDVYEIARTAREICDGRWKRIGLQFPDHMLVDAPWVVGALGKELASLTVAGDRGTAETNVGSGNAKAASPRIYILADTSYSACCVDQIAAEHADADVVVHYGRSCLSPTSRLPVIYVFTKHTLDMEDALAAFEKEIPDKETKAVLMADVTYQDHVQQLARDLQSRGYASVLSTEIVHDPSGAIPNRKLVTTAGEIPSSKVDLRDYTIFHVSTPPTALLLALASRVKSLYIHPTSSSTSAPAAAATQRLLGRRYARLLSLASAGIIGILVNTLSVSNYLASIDNIRKQISDAGKKSYTVVVGKLNPAKLANFAEVDGWVVVGCWESSLVEDDAGFYRPVITPFELEVALAGDENRVWTGEWWGGIEGVIKVEGRTVPDATGVGKGEGIEVGEGDEDESAPPEFDLRTGRLVSHSRPMRNGDRTTRKESVDQPAGATGSPVSSALALRSKGELATVNGVVSPGAEYLRSQRTWQGLGSDYTAEESAAIEEGRSGVARGYTVGEETGTR